MDGEVIQKNGPSFPHAGRHVTCDGCARRCHHTRRGHSIAGQGERSCPAPGPTPLKSPRLVVEFGNPSGVDAEEVPVLGGGVERGRSAS